MPNVSTCWEQNSPWGLGEQQAVHDPAVYPHSKEVPQHPGLL